MTAASLRIAALLPTTGVRQLPTAAIGLNTLSLAMWVEFGSARAVLGGDLEEHGKPDEGWQAIVSSTVRPQTAARLFKVPHHGSPTGQHDPVWSTVLSAEPIAVVTPYAKGRRKLPASADLGWLCDRTRAVFVTSYALSKPPRSRPSSIERAMSRAVRDRQALGVDMGQVRVRIDATTGTPSVEMLGSAYRGCSSAA
jgi:hypothetical protein